MKRTDTKTPDKQSVLNQEQAGHLDKVQIFRILLVDHEPQVRKLLHDAIHCDHIDVVEASSLQQAREFLKNQSIDLVLLDLNLQDGSGLTLANDLKETHPTTQTIVITGEPSLQRAMEAIRAGASDILAKPINITELNDRVHAAMARSTKTRRQHSRYNKLRKICKRLNESHREVSQQVDVLCNDLVTAYQELATQMQQVVQTSEFTHFIGDELDLEQLLRKTLEYILEKAGPTNAAIFLPAAGDEFTLGGYINYDCTHEAADMLLEHLADVAAPKIANQNQLLHITDDQAMERWLGDDAAWFAESHVIAMPCQHDNEPLAIIILFRDRSLAFTEGFLETAKALCPLLGEHLAKVIRVHHRMIPGLNDFNFEDNSSPF